MRRDLPVADAGMADERVADAAVIEAGARRRSAVDRDGVGVLGRDTCLLRLGRAGIGRVAVTVGALPAIFPVNYAVDGEDIVFRTTPGTKLAAAIDNAVVAFEVDHVDRMSHGGWSVMVVGPCRVVTDPYELTRINRLPLARWVRDGEEESTVCIRSELISGRALGPCEREMDRRRTTDGSGRGRAPAGAGTGSRGTQHPEVWLG